MLFEQEKIKSLNKLHFAENKTDITQQVLRMQYVSLLPKYIINISGVFYVLSRMRTEVA